jgi:hypothetical protein
MKVKNMHHVNIYINPVAIKVRLIYQKPGEIFGLPILFLGSVLFPKLVKSREGETDLRLYFRRERSGERETTVLGREGVLESFRSSSGHLRTYFNSG